ncbi:hypothetical protein RB653_004767 [Dictyostelium firmibasis]|uniref:Uncharacterized protein n=1 Tax=Dictyostelium firmibasis TaxID=79012 RepID=A0AAN7YYK4_9MYCE
MLKSYNNLIFLIISFLFLLKLSNADDDFPFQFLNDQSNQVIFFTQSGFQGERFVYDTNMGYVELPNEFHNNVGSYISGTTVCFIKWDPFEQHQIYSHRVNGNYSSENNFGSRIDGVYNGLCKDKIW